MVGEAEIPARAGEQSSLGARVVETMRNFGIVLSGLLGLAYACGYLVLRARSLALGTDPGFAFIDQAYVFQASASRSLCCSRCS
jgi:hypothetical protein